MFMKRHQLPILALLAMCLFFSACKSETDSNEQDLPTPPEVTDTTEVKDSENTAGITEDYNDTQRLIWQKPEVVIDLLGDLENQTVADIGAGTGFFSLRLAQKAKKVIAIDIDPRFIEYLDSAKVWELPEMYQDRLEARLARPKDPKLKANEADVAIIVNTYIYIPDRVNYVKNLMKGLSDNGKLLIVDFKKKRTPVGPPRSVRIPLYKVEEELYKAGYSSVKTFDTMLDYQYVLIAEK
jgi:SAM-dependent methyltransferase